jgi:hypothetical protein
MHGRHPAGVIKKVSEAMQPQCTIEKRALSGGFEIGSREAVSCRRLLERPPRPGRVRSTTSPFQRLGILGTKFRRFGRTTRG